MAKDPSKPLVRPVRCAVCQNPMLYSGAKGSTPELSIVVSLPKMQDAVTIKNLHHPFGTERFYIHLKCWNSLPIVLHPCGATVQEDGTLSTETKPCFP